MMIISGLFGGAIGFVTMATNEPQIKASFDLIGLIALWGGLYVLIPHVEWGPLSAETSQIISNSVALIAYTTLGYLVGDACGSIGNKIVTDIF